MEQLYQSAGVYHDVLPNPTKECAQDVLDCVNTAGGEEKAKLRELLSFRAADGCTQMNNRALLKEGSNSVTVYCSIM